MSAAIRPRFRTSRRWVTPIGGRSVFPLATVVAAVCAAVIVTATGASPLRAQSAPAPAITVSGAVTTPLTLTAADLAGMPRASVTTTSGGIVTAYEGVWVADVLKKAGVPIGALRGGNLAGYVIASASDGYRVVFSIGELDPELASGQYLLADQANGKPLFGETGAFRLVVPSDKRGARSVRMLSSFVVQTLAPAAKP